MSKNLKTAFATLPLVAVAGLAACANDKTETAPVATATTPAEATTPVAPEARLVATTPAILASLAGGDRSVGELGAPFAISQPAISRHLRVLEAAGLISRSRRATARLSHGQAEPLREGVAWLAQRLKSERQKGLAIVFASHEPELVDTVATRVIELGAPRG